MTQRHKQIDALQTEIDNLKNYIQKQRNLYEHQIEQLTSDLESEKEKSQSDKNWCIAEKEKIGKEYRRKIEDLDQICARLAAKDSMKVVKGQFNQLELSRIRRRVSHDMEYLIAVYSVLIPFPLNKNGASESKKLWDLVNDQVPHYQQSLGVSSLSLVNILRSQKGWLASFETTIYEGWVT